MTGEIKNIQCRNCGESYRPNSRKNTHYCSPRCGDDFRNKRKSDIRLSKKRNILLLNKLDILSGSRKQIDVSTLAKEGFNFKCHDEIRETSLPNSNQKATVFYYGRYSLHNENNLTFITRF